MSKRIVTSVVALGAAMALAACGSDSDGAASPAPSTPASTAEQTTSAVTSEAAPTTSSAAPTTSAASSVAPGKPMTVNKTIKDQVLGHTITVLKYVDNAYQPTAADIAKYPTLEGKKVVVVQIKAKSGTKYYGGVDYGDFRLVKAGEAGYDAFPNEDLDATSSKAGYPVYQDILSGKTGTGWIVFTPPKTYTKLVFGYKRLKTSLPSGKTLPEQVYPVPLN